MILPGKLPTEDDDREAVFRAVNALNDCLVVARAIELGLPDEMIAAAWTRILMRMKPAGGLQ